MNGRLGLLLLVCSCGSSGPPPDQPCALSMPVQGGLTGTLGGASCGESGGSLLFWTSADLTGPTVDASFATTIASGQTGTLVVQQLQISSRDADGGEQRWQTPAAACSLYVTDNKSSPTDVFKNRYILSGTGTCAQPAAPATGSPGPPVEIGDFTFHAFIDPP
jgi:hypothetical protein